MAAFNDDDWPPREEETIETDNSTFIDFIKIYTPVLLVLAERVGAQNIIDILDRIKSGPTTEQDIKTLQQWTELDEIGNALAELTPEEINEMINSKKLPELQPYEDAIGIPDKDGVSIINRGKRGRCLISYENVKPTHTCITLNNQTYSVNAFKTYYEMEKEKKKNDPEYIMVTPTRNPITPKEIRILDQFFARLDESVPITRNTSTQKRKRTTGGKKTRKSKSKKSRKTHRKQRRSQ
jgi:hypothetical protein